MLVAPAVQVAKCYRACVVSVWSRADSRAGRLTEPDRLREGSGREREGMRDGGGGYRSSLRLAASLRICRFPSRLVSLDCRGRGLARCSHPHVGCPHDRPGSDVFIGRRLIEIADGSIRKRRRWLSRARRAAHSPARTPGRTSRVRSRRAGHSPRTSLAKEAEAAGQSFSHGRKAGERAETRSGPNSLPSEPETSQRRQRRSDWMAPRLHHRSQRPASRRSETWRLPRGSSLGPLNSSR